MADNVTLNSGTGGATLATDDVGGIHYQRMKLSVGADGAATDAALTAPLPVRLSDGTSAITTLPVSLASVPSHAVTNAGTFATQPAGSVAHDATATSVNPVLTGGYSSAAAPADVTADGEAVRGWFLRNGAQAMQPTYSGVLASTGNGASGTGVLRVTMADNSTGILAGVTTVTTVSTVTSLTGGGVASGASDTGNPVKVGGRYNSSAPTLTNGQRGDLQLDASANLKVAIASGGATAGTAGTPGSDVLSVQGIASMTPVITAGGLRTDAIMNAQTALTPKFAAIAASSSGNNTLVAAVTSKKVRVLAYSLIGNGAVNAKFQSGASGTDLTGLKYIAAAGGGICAPFNPVGWFETGSNTLLNLNLSGAVAVGGELVYVEV